MKRRVLALFVLLAMAALAQPALAQTYNMSFNLEPGAWMGPVDLTWHETVGSNTVDYSADDVAAGPQVITFLGSTPNGYATSNDVYCVDMYHWDQSPSTVYVDPFTAVSSLTDYNAPFEGLTQAQFNQRLDEAAWLYDTYNPTVQGATGVTKEEDGAALQLAIWNVMAGANSGFSFTNGGVNGSIFSAVQGLTTTYYDSVGNNVGDGTLFQTDRTLEPNSGQDVLGPPSMAPEASSLSLLAFALIAPLLLIGIRKRRLAPTQARS